MKSARNNRGFTLVEAVVVIGLVFALALVGFNRIIDGQKSERDAVRRADLNDLKSRLLVYYYENKREFPGSLDALPGDDLPRDPLADSGYSYTYTVDSDIDGQNNDFTLKATAESPFQDQSSIVVRVER